MSQVQATTYILQKLCDNIRWRNITVHFSTTEFGFACAWLCSHGYP